MRCIAIALVLAFCSSAAAAPVLVTKDNYKSAADSPFDLSTGYLEDFDDGAVNTPGLSTLGAVQFVAGGIGSGNAIQPSTLQQTLDGNTNIASLSFAFEQPYPTQIGFVTTQAAFPAQDVNIVLLPVSGTPLIAPFASDRFFGITDPNGIQSIEIKMLAAVPGEPFFQIDHLQYVPEPSAATLLAIGVSVLLIWGCKGSRGFRWLRVSLATLVMLLVIREAAGITTFGDPANYVVSPGTGRDGVVHIAAANGNFGSERFYRQVGTSGRLATSLSLRQRQRRLM